MAAEAVHVLSAGRSVTTTRSSTHSSDALWIDTRDLERATGWRLSSEGLCRDDECAVLAAADRQRLVDGDTVCASELWQTLGRPVLHDAARATWLLGEEAGERRRSLESLEAPDFTLPDITGKLHSLSDFRGKKVFLATWASW
jgi:hypothetical protein